MINNKIMKHSFSIVDLELFLITNLVKKKLLPDATKTGKVKTVLSTTNKLGNTP